MTKSQRIQEAIPVNRAASHFFKPKAPSWAEAKVQFRLGASKC